MEWLNLGAQFGITGFCIAYFMWRDNRRDKNDAEREEKRGVEQAETNAWIRTRLVETVENNTGALRDFAAALRAMPLGCPLHSISRLKGENNAVSPGHE
jgi:hypothetical protein